MIPVRSEMSKLMNKLQDCIKFLSEDNNRHGEIFCKRKTNGETSCDILHAKSLYDRASTAVMIHCAKTGSDCSPIILS